MRRKTRYRILVILFAANFYGCEFVQKETQSSNLEAKDLSVALGVKEIYLPPSTTKQVVHHQGYSLCYSEAHEQAEWVAYELKASHLSSTNFKRPYFEVDKAIKSGAAEFGIPHKWR